MFDARVVAQLLLDAEQLVVLRDTVRARQRTRLDLRGARAYRDVGDRCIRGLTRAVRYHGAVAGGLRHAGDLHRAYHATEVEEVGLQNLKHLVADQIAEGVHAKLLFATGHGDVKGRFHLFLLLIPIPGQGFLIEVVVVFLQNSPDANGLLHGVRTVAINHQIHFVSEFFPGHLDQFLCSAGGIINIRGQVITPACSKFYSLGLCFHKILIHKVQGLFRFFISELP